MDIRSVSSSPAALPPDNGATARATPAAPGAKPAARAQPAPAAAAVDAKKAAAPDALDAAVEKINKSLQTAGQNVEFSVDDDSKRLVVKVVDQETQEVLRQMPSKEALEIAKGLDRVKGMLIKQEA